MSGETNEQDTTSQFDCMQASTSAESSPAKSPLMDVQNQLDTSLNPSPEPMCSSDAITDRPLSSSMPCSPIRQLPEVDQLVVSSKNAPPTTVANRFPFNIRETVDWLMG